jgi:hypothetical protein
MENKSEKKTWEDVKNEFNEQMSEFPGGGKAVLRGMVIGVVIVLSCFINIWLGLAGMATVLGLLLANCFGVYMEPEFVVTIASSLVAIPFALVLALLVLLTINLIQGIILLFI